MYNTGAKTKSWFHMLVIVGLKIRSYLIQYFLHKRVEYLSTFQSKRLQLWDIQSGRDLKSVVTQST